MIEKIDRKCRYCGLPHVGEGSCLANVNKMPDRVEKELRWIYNIGRTDGTAGIYQARTAITQARAELLKVILECVPPKETDKADTHFEVGWTIGYASCRSQVIEAIERIFGKEKHGQDKS